VYKKFTNLHASSIQLFNFHVYENSTISNIDTLIPAVTTLANLSIHLDHIEKMFLRLEKICMTPSVMSQSIPWSVNVFTIRKKYQNVMGTHITTGVA
jgi:hypothetical protein